MSKKGRKMSNNEDDLVVFMSGCLGCLIMIFYTLVGLAVPAAIIYVALKLAGVV